MEELKKIVKRLSEIEKVRGVVLMNFRGKVLESTLEKSDKKNVFEKTLHDHIIKGRQFGEKLKSGDLKRSYVEFHDFVLSCEIIEDKGILTVIADTGANMGRIRMETKKNKKKIVELLSS